MAARQSSFTTSTTTVEACSYSCGSCGKTVKLKPTDAVCCHNCAFRILYKQRAKGVLQYEAS